MKNLFLEPNRYKICPIFTKKDPNSYSILSDFIFENCYDYDYCCLHFYEGP